MTEQYPEPTDDSVPDGTQLPDETAEDVPEEGNAGVGDVELEDVG